MFYANNEQVKGIFLNGRNCDYLACGFGKIIPEDRNAEQLNLNLADKYLNKYRIGFGSVKDGYDNALVSPRFDEPDSSGVFHTPFMYYYNGDIVSTKKVPVLITDGNNALRNALVYSDMNINGAINYFATNTDFQGHNVNVFKEAESYQVYQALLNYEMLNNCGNFDLNIETRFSKASYPTLCNCNNFSGNFRYAGNHQDYSYPGFRGFLYGCKDGVFNIDCTNMHGGGNDANVTNYFNFSCISDCNNIRLNITGSSWQVWPHDHSFSSNCNINTYNVIPGFGYMNYCNFNVVLPKDSKPEMDKPFNFLNNAENCNYNLNALDSNLFNYRSGVGHTAFFGALNNCNLNLLVNNTVSFDYSFGNSFNNCNIVFDNIKADLATFTGWDFLYNCNITGNVNSKSSAQGFLERCDGLNVNLNFAKSSCILFALGCNNIKGNIVAGNMTYVNSSSYMNLNVNNGNVMFNNIDHSSFNVSNAIVQFRNVDHTDARGKSGMFISAIDNCHNISLYRLNVVDDALIENVYGSFLAFNYGSFTTWRVNDCNIRGFPTVVAYTVNCKFDAGLVEAMYRNSIYVKWLYVWPHGSRASSGQYGYFAGLRSVRNNTSRCSISSADMILGGNKSYENVNYMVTNLDTYYNGTVTANLPIYNMNITLNVDCNTLNLGVFQSGPPHGFGYSSISADNIYCTTGTNYYVQANYGTRLYCANFCNVPFSPKGCNFSDNHQPVLLINSYQHSNGQACQFNGGITRIGRLSYNGGMPVHLGLNNGACVFINNAKLGTTTVNGALLFLGTNVHFEGQLTVINGGLVVNSTNYYYSMSDMYTFVNRNNFAWNVLDSGPWGPQSLLNYCVNV